MDWVCHGWEDAEWLFFGAGFLYIVCRKMLIYNPEMRQSITLPALKSNVFFCSRRLPCFDQEQDHVSKSKCKSFMPVYWGDANHHIFWKGCIKMAISRQNKCSTCRKKVTAKELIRVFLPSIRWSIHQHYQPPCKAY